MTKHDKVFIALLTVSVALIMAVMAQNLSAQGPHRVVKKQTAAEPSSRPYDPARTGSVRKKFEDMGLHPHEGRFWKP